MLCHTTSKIHLSRNDFQGKGDIQWDNLMFEKDLQKWMPMHKANLQTFCSVWSYPSDLKVCIKFNNTAA